MFSYRHAFHAGNHADVLKHMVLIATLKHLIAKEAPLAVFDTHAGAGLYRLDGDYAQTSGEAQQGFLKLIGSGTTTQALPPALRDYVELITGFNPHGSHKIYPGSPFIAQRLLRPRDKLKLFELHPTDAKALAGNIAQLECGRQVAVLREDGFEGLKKYLPPPQRRALVLMDPSYEIKSDYARILNTLEDAVKRFATGVYVIWHPIIPRPEAHDLPRRLKALARRTTRNWLHVTLQVKAGKTSGLASTSAPSRPGMPASGVFVLNPPHTLKTALEQALPPLAHLLRQDNHDRFSLDTGS